MRVNHPQFERWLFPNRYSVNGFDDGVVEQMAYKAKAAGWDRHREEVELAWDMMDNQLDSASRDGIHVRRVDRKFVCKREEDGELVDSIILVKDRLRRIRNWRKRVNEGGEPVDFGTPRLQAYTTDTKTANTTIPSAEARLKNFTYDLSKD